MNPASRQAISRVLFFTQVEVLSLERVTHARPDVKIVGCGVDTLVLNVSYADKQFQPIKLLLDVNLQEELNHLRGEARLATTQLASGRSPLDVQRQMGHSTLTMTNHYASLFIEHIKRSHDAHSPLRAYEAG
jgi:hypothetical protein